MRKQIPPFLLGEVEWPDAITSGDLLFHIPYQILNYTSDEIILSAPGIFNGLTASDVRNGIVTTVATSSITFAEVDFVWYYNAGVEQWLMGGCGNVFRQNRLAVVKSAADVTQVFKGNTAIMTITDYLTVGKRYKIQLYRNVNDVRCVIYDYEADAETYDTTVTNTGTVGNYNFAIGQSWTTQGAQPASFQLYSFIINTETFQLVSGTTVTGTLGTVLPILGDLSSFWTFVSKVNDITGKDNHARLIAIDNNQALVRFDYNSEMDEANTALGLLFWNAAHAPNEIILNNLGANYQGKNYLFQCIRGNKGDLLLFKTKRTSSTTPSIEQVSAYLQLTPGDIITFNGDSFTFGGEDITF